MDAHMELVLVARMAGSLGTKTCIDAICCNMQSDTVPRGEPSRVGVQPCAEQASDIALEDNEVVNNLESAAELQSSSHVDKYDGARTVHIHTVLFAPDGLCCHGTETTSTMFRKFWDSRSILNFAFLMGLCQ